MAKNLNVSSLRLRLSRKFSLDNIGALDVLQRLGLVSDNCVNFDGIASVDASRILKQWDEHERKLAEESAQYARGND